MKFLKKSLILVLIFAALIYFVGIPYMHNQTKKFSPNKTVFFTLKGTDLEIAYSSPAKKNRSIFGELVPYNQIWRTGANEPTTFTNQKDILVMDKLLPANTYSLWTIPNENSWKVIFNSEVPDWGVTRINGNQTTRDADKDFLTVEVPVTYLENPIEDFVIAIETVNDQTYLGLAWDTSKILVPLNEFYYKKN